MSKPFKIRSANAGEPIFIPAGEFYFNSKARARRMCLDSISSPARQVYSCLELGSMGYRRELVVWKNDEGGKPHRITVTRIAVITKLDAGTVRRALRELEAAGLVERRPINPERPMVKGNVAIYCFTYPRKVAHPKIEGTRALNIPSWMPEDWKAMRSFLKRNRVAVDPGIEGTRALLSEGEEVARALEKAEKRAREYADKLRTEAKTAAHKERKKRNNSERRGGPSPSSSVPEPETPMMVMNPHLSEMAQVAEAVAAHSDAGNDWVITHLISEPRAIAPDAEIVEIVEQIHANWGIASKKANPLGYLVKCVAKAFTPVVLASRRARARAAAAEEALLASQWSEERAHELADTDAAPVSDEEARRRLRAMRGEP